MFFLSGPSKLVQVTVLRKGQFEELAAYHMVSGHRLTHQHVPKEIVHIIQHGSSQADCLCYTLLLWLPYGRPCHAKTPPSCLDIYFTSFHLLFGDFLISTLKVNFIKS